MPSTLRGVLEIDPIPALLEAEDAALAYFVQRDLLGDAVDDAEMIRSLNTPAKLLKKQQHDGRWKYPSKSFDAETGQNYDLLETFRTLGLLIEMYALDRTSPAIERAAEYVFSCQTEEGDIRGILGNQLMPYYHGAILELLVKAGFDNDPRTGRALEWLLNIRQKDGGWIVPAQAVPSKERTPEFWRGKPVQPDRSLPHAHLATGMALRAFAAHPDWRSKPAVLTAAAALKSRLFKPDAYNDRRASAYWFKFQFPFWWTNLLTALDSLARLGFIIEDEDIRAGINWFSDNQEPDGLWATGYGAGRKARSNQCWVGLAVCRMIKRYWI